MTYRQREIVLVPFPYSDLSATKRRPVLIVSNNDYNNGFDDVVVCVITSNRFRDDYSVLKKIDPNGVKVIREKIQKANDMLKNIGLPEELLRKEIAK